MADKYDAFLDGETELLNGDDAEIDAFLDAPGAGNTADFRPTTPVSGLPAFGLPGMTVPQLGSVADVNKAFLEGSGAQAIFNNMPMIGATVATLPLGGAGVFARGLPALVNAAKSAGAAAMGGGAGGAIQAAVEGEDVTQGAMDAALEQGGADIAGSGLLKGVQKLGAPTAKIIGEEGARVLQFAKDKGLPVSPRELLPTWASKAVDEAVNILLPGRYGLSKKKDQIANAMKIDPNGANQIILDAAQVYGRAAPEETAALTATAVQSALEKIRPPKGSGAASEADQAYDLFFKALGNGFKQVRTLDQMPSLRSAMDNIRAREASLVGDQQDNATLSFLSNLEKKLSPGNGAAGLSGDDLYKMKNRLAKIRGGDKRNVGELRDAILSEFETLAATAGNSGEAMKTLKSANAAWATGRKFAGHKLVKQIAEGNLNTAQLFRNENIPLLKEMQKRLPPEDYENLLTMNLENMINNSGSEQGFVKYLNGAKLLGVINRHRKMLDSVYPKEAIQSLENLAMYAKVHADAPGSQHGAEKVVRNMVSWPTTIAAASADPASLMVGGAASYGMAKAMMDPNSRVFKWLTGTLEEEGAGSFLTRSGLRWAGQDSTAP